MWKMYLHIRLHAEVDSPLWDRRKHEEGRRKDGHPPVKRSRKLESSEKVGKS